MKVETGDANRGEISGTEGDPQQGWEWTSECGRVRGKIPQEHSWGAGQQAGSEGFGLPTLFFCVAPNVALNLGEPEI